MDSRFDLIDDEAERDQRAEFERLRVNAIVVRALLTSKGWVEHVEPFLRDYVERAMMQISQPGTRSSDEALKGGCDFAGALIAHLRGTLRSAQVALEQHTREDNPIESERFG